MDYHLQHHGIKGQKWGIRRYQNKDGSLTPAGKKKAKSNDSEDIKSMSDDELRKKVNRLRNEDRYYDLTKPSSRFKKASDTAKVAADDAKIITDTYSKIIDPKDRIARSKAGLASRGLNTASKTADVANKISSISTNKKHAKVTKAKLESMDDKELSDSVNRLDLERQYSSLKSKNISRGKTNIRDVLSVSGDALTVGASAVGLAVGIIQLKKLLHGGLNEAMVYNNSNTNELYHYGVPGMKWGHHKYSKYQNQVTTKKTSFGRALAMDKAAAQNARNISRQNAQNAKGLRAKAHNAFGYTGAANNFDARSKSYSESSKRLAESGRMNDAVRAKATAINNKNYSNWNNKVATSKNFVKRMAIANNRVGTDKQKYYSNAGRQYTLRSESFKNAMTMGIYGSVKDSKYKKKYSAEERLARMV